MYTINQRQMDALAWEIVRGLVFQFLTKLLHEDDLDGYLDLWDEHTDNIYHAILPEATQMTLHVRDTRGAIHYARDIYQLAHKQLIINLWMPPDAQHAGADDSVVIWQDSFAHEWKEQDEAREKEDHFDHLTASNGWQ